MTNHRIHIAGYRLKDRKVVPNIRLSASERLRQANVTDENPDPDPVPSLKSARSRYGQRRIRTTPLIKKATPSSRGRSIGLLKCQAIQNDQTQARRSVDLSLRWRCRRRRPIWGL